MAACHALPSCAGLHGGVLIVVQRFRSDLGLYVHLHALVADGCFRATARDVEFLPVRALCESHLRSVITRLHHDLADDEAEHGEPTEELDESLSTCLRIGARRPRLARLELDAESADPAPMLVSAFDMHLHAAVTVDGRDRRPRPEPLRQMLMIIGT